MTKTVEVEKELQELLIEKLEDPNNERTSDWIFTDKPDTHNQFPRLIISLLDAQKTGFSLNSTDRFHRQRVQVSVQVGDNNKFDVDGDGEIEGAGYVKWWIAERCDEIVQANQDRFRDLGDDIYSLLPDSANPSSPGNTRQTSCDYILRRRRQ